MLLGQVIKVINPSNQPPAASRLSPYRGPKTVPFMNKSYLQEQKALGDFCHCLCPTVGMFVSSVVKKILVTGYHVIKYYFCKYRGPKYENCIIADGKDHR